MRRAVVAIRSLGGGRDRSSAKEEVTRTLTPLTYSKPCPENKKARDMPIHPLLVTLLEDWRASGWEETFGRSPKPDDLVMPYWKRRPGRRGRHGGLIGEMAMLTKNAMWKALQRDLLLVGSSTGTRARCADILNWATHGRSKEKTIDDYTNMER